MKNKPIATARVSVRNNKTGRTVSFKNLKVFVDTGSSMTILRDDVAPALKKAGAFETAPARIITAAGEKDALAYKDSSLCIESTCYRGDVLVSGNMPGHVLLGADFLNASKCKVDFRKKRLECGNTSIPFEMEE